MGSTFVEIDEKGFWMDDRVLELWLRLLALHIEETPDKAPLAKKTRDNWLLASRGYFGGHIPVRLDEAVSTNEGREIVLAAIKSLMDSLARGPELLDHGMLNLLGFEGFEYKFDFETERLLQVGNAFVALIAGEIQSDASSTEHSPGFRAAT